MQTSSSRPPHTSRTPSTRRHTKPTVTSIPHTSTNIAITLTTCLLALFGLWTLVSPTHPRDRISPAIASSGDLAAASHAPGLGFSFASTGEEVTAASHVAQRFIAQHLDSERHLSYSAYVRWVRSLHVLEAGGRAAGQVVCVLHAERFAELVFHARQFAFFDPKAEAVQVAQVKQADDHDLPDHHRPGASKHPLRDRLQLAVENLDVDELSDVMAQIEKHKINSEHLPLLRAAQYMHSKLLTDANARLADEPEPARKAAEVVKTPELDKSRYPTDEFVIAVTACNRPKTLRRCLESLLSVDGISESKSQITVYQDGANADVKAVVDSFELVQLVQHPRRGGDQFREAADRIAAHYKFTLSTAFERNPQAPHVIVVEDDMIFAPDFLTYFSQLAYLYTVDPSVYCITSWNDNGKKSLVGDPTALYRTEFFVGLGWLVSRSLYKNELEPHWPNTHWDHWMRTPRQRRGRECVYPEVSRNFNIGVEGAHSDQDLFSAYFKDIVLNQQPGVDLGDADRLIAHNYERQLLANIRAAHVLRSFGEIRKEALSNKLLVVYYRTTGPEDRMWETVIAPYFGLWHSTPNIRGMHHGLIQFKWRGNHLMLIASYSKYAREKPDDVKFFDRSSFGKSYDDLDSEVKVIRAERGVDCETACKDKYGLKCDAGSLPYLNNCRALEAHFECSGGCHHNIGKDQPAMVTDPSASNHGACLMNTGPFSCAGKHMVTSRLCPCAAG